MFSLSQSIYHPCLSRQANEGPWKKQEDFSSSLSKHNEDLRKFPDFDISTSSPLTINDLGGGNSLSNWSPHSSLSRGNGNPSGPHKDNHPPVPHKGKALEELERRAAADKALSVEVRLVGIHSVGSFLFVFSNHLCRLHCKSCHDVATKVRQSHSGVRSTSSFPRQQSGTGRRSGQVSPSTVPRTSTVCWRRPRLS